MAKPSAFISPPSMDMEVVTGVQPSARQHADIAFALPIMQRLGELNIGHAIAVKEREVIAVETMEGTQAMIRRTGQLCPSGRWVLVRTAPASAESPYLSEAIKPETIEQLKLHGCTCLTVGTGAPLSDRPRLIDAANRTGIAIVTVE